MTGQRTINVQYPLGGENRQAGYAQKEPPFTTPRAINVRSTGPLERRVRGGTRPMLSKYISNDLGTNITALQKVTYRDSDGDLQTDVIVIADGNMSIIQSESLTTTKSYLAIDGDHLTIGGDYLIFKSTVAAVNPIGDTDAFNIVEHGGRLYIADSTPKVYNPATGSIQTVQNAPTSEPIIAVFCERLIFGGQNNNFLASRQGDFEDYDFGDRGSDIGRAIAGNAGGGGVVGETIKCILPYRDEVCLIGTLDSTWALTGGSISKKQVSRNVGVIAPRAACVTPDGLFVILSRTGLYAWQAGSSQEPVKFSQARIPEELRDLDPTTNDIHMQYDHKNNGVYLFVTPSTGAGEHWWLDIKNRAFWQFSFGNNNHQPLCSCKFGQSGDSDILLGCKDGYIREFSNSATNDDGTAVTSHLLLGPFHMGQSYGKDGQLVKMIADFADNSSGITWRTVVADTAEEAVDNAVSDLEGGTTDNVDRNGTFAANHNLPTYPRSRGSWLVVWLTSTGRWAYESLSLFANKLGNLR